MPQAALQRRQDSQRARHHQTVDEIDGLVAVCCDEDERKKYSAMCSKVCTPSTKIVKRMARLVVLATVKRNADIAHTPHCSIAQLHLYPATSYGTRTHSNSMTIATIVPRDFEPKKPELGQRCACARSQWPRCPRHHP